MLELNKIKDALKLEVAKNKLLKQNRNMIHEVFDEIEESLNEELKYTSLEISFYKDDNHIISEIVYNDYKLEFIEDNDTIIAVIAANGKEEYAKTFDFTVDELSGEVQNETLNREDVIRMCNEFFEYIYQ